MGSAFHELDKPSYGDKDPRFLFLSRQFSERGVAFRRNDYNLRSLELAQLNNGEWSSACVFGGYTVPLEEVRSQGFKITEQDQKQLATFSLEESEVMVAYVDLLGFAHFVRFETGFGPDGQHFTRCITKPTTAIELL